VENDTRIAYCEIYYEMKLNLLLGKTTPGYNFMLANVYVFSDVKSYNFYSLQ